MAIFESTQDPSEKRDKVVGVRMSERERYVLKRFAKKHKLNIGNFIRKAIREAIRTSNTKVK